jgi:hypothetical protein
MATPKHTDPYGAKAKDLLQRDGFKIEDHLPTTREEFGRFAASSEFSSGDRLLFSRAAN